MTQDAIGRLRATIALIISEEVSAVDENGNHHDMQLNGVVKAADRILTALGGPIIDECEHGHKFAKLPSHPLNKDGMARCPNCMAGSIDILREKAAALDGDEVERRVSLAIRGALGLRGQQITDMGLDDKIDEAARASLKVIV
jgi:hypothetical protein